MCIFCNVASGEIPPYRVYEDGKILAFLDIKPVNPGHVLVITKNHYQNLEEVPAEELTSLILVVKKIGKMLKDKLGVPGYNVWVNNDPVAGQVIPHLHFHVIPRRENDGHEQWDQGEYGENEPEELIKKLTS